MSTSAKTLGGTPRSSRPGSSSSAPHTPRQQFPVRENLNSVGKRRDLLEDTKFRTDKYKTAKSHWTPVIHKPSNDQIFLERRDLIGHWFDLWTDKQRRYLLSDLFERSSKKQLMFVQGFFSDKVPQQHLDFTSVLPRFLSLYIFSFLDPKSLSMAAMASWHWKFLTEQDELWIPKSTRHGWYLPYSPSGREYGAWKQHYIACVKTLDYDAADRNAKMYGNLGDGTMKRDHGPKTPRKQDPFFSQGVEGRPPWLDPDPKPTDLEQSTKAFLSSVDPNDPKGVRSSLTLDGRVGGGRTPRLDVVNEYGLDTAERKSEHRLQVTGSSPTRQTLSAISLQQDEKVPGSMTVEQHFSPPVRLASTKRPDLSGGAGDYPVGMETKDLRALSYNYMSHSNPRIIFISSNIPASEILLDCVLFGVVPIVYDYNSSTLQSLLGQMYGVLRSRHARSIAFFIDGLPGDMNIAREHTTTLESLGEGETRDFWQCISTNVLSTSLGGHIDMFLPLAASECGMELVLQLGILTGMTFTTPTDIRGSSYNHILGEWLSNPENVPNPTLYFDSTKLLSWINTATKVTEALKVTRKHLKSYFDCQYSDLVSQLAGEMLFEMFKLKDLSGMISEVMPVVNEACVSLKDQRNHVKDSLYFVTEFLRKKLKTRDGDENEKGQFDELDSTSRSHSRTETPQLQSRTGYQRLPSELRSDHPDRRAAVVSEILRHESGYTKLLAVVQDVFMTPLKAALDSNRPIISAANVQAIFNDSLQLLSVSRELERELAHRVAEWSPAQCIGDVFVKLCGKLKCYTNYMNNYPTALLTMERCLEQSPTFRAFLRRHEKKPNTNQMRLSELFLLPTNHMAGHIKLLSALELHTPPDHPDLQDLARAINKLNELNTYIDNCKLRAERDHRMMDLQKRIQGCPMLMEANRYLIKEECVAHLKPLQDRIKHDSRVYEHTENFGLFLFNDALLIAIRTTRNFPYDKSVEHKYQFHASVCLNKLRVDDLPDTKYVRNVFSIVTPKRRWFCAFETHEAKQGFILTLESAVRGSIRID